MRFVWLASVLLVVGGILAAATPPRSKRQFINPNGVPKPTGYTQVVTSGPGRMIFLSGQGGAAPDGTMPEDFATQAKNTFENIGRCLAAANATFEDIVKINYYVTDMVYTAELRRIRAQYLNQAEPPASTLVQTALGKGLRLEVEVIAIVPE